MGNVPGWALWLAGGMVVFMILLFLFSVLFVSSINNPPNPDEHSRDNWRH